MSADNWARCPKCLADHEAKAQADISDLKKHYGKMDADEFSAKMADIKGRKQKPADTLREDYEIGVDSDGVFRLNYGCSCERCGFEYTYQTEVATSAARESG